MLRCWQGMMENWMVEVPKPAEFGGYRQPQCSAVAAPAGQQAAATSG
jgi:hypothetical protein